MESIECSASDATIRKRLEKEYERLEKVARKHGIFLLSAQMITIEEIEKMNREDVKQIYNEIRTNTILR